ncbi:Dhrs1 [Symbiodinium pilosum]|uniref:Dhrs1 protein n=1 Tax=Symbiodinium pilosum TaxID=2952 RepID=A0A812X4D3_SYMPI|nr:Dhrs1 [Symbiodinium pilosum]
MCYWYQRLVAVAVSFAGPKAAEESPEAASKEETPAVKEGSPEVGAEAAVEAGEASKESAEGTSAAPDAEPKPAEPAAESAGATEETEAVADSSADPAKGAEPAADADPAGVAAEPSDAPGPGAVDPSSQPEKSEVKEGAAEGAVPTEGAGGAEKAEKAEASPEANGFDGFMHLLDPGVVDNRQTISAFWTKCGQDVVNSRLQEESSSAEVTGASRGIGKAELGPCDSSTEKTCKFLVTGRRKDAVEATAALATRAGGEGVAVVCDHAVDEQVKNAFAQIQAQTGGKLDILVNNAFQDPAQRDIKSDELLGKGAKFFELPLQVWDDVHRVGLRSHYVASYYAAPLLLNATRDDWRPLLCVTSAPAAVTYYYATAYGVAKAGSDRLVRDLQVELGPLGIDCVSIWPGVVYTEFVQSLYEKGDVERINRVTGGRDPNVVCESPLLTGRVITRLAEDPMIRKPPLLSSGGLTSRVCVVAEGARDLGIRDGGVPGTVAAELYGPDREPAASIRSLGYLLPAFLPDKLPPSLRWLVEPGGPLASKDVRVPFELMAQDPRTEDPRKQDLKDFAKVLTNTVSVPD